MDELVAAHEAYLQQIDSVALLDPEKKFANMKLLNERMDKLDEAYKADAEVAKDIIFEGARRNEELRQIKSENETHCGAILTLEKQVKELMNNMKRAEGHIYSAGDISALNGRIENPKRKMISFDENQRSLLEKKESLNSNGFQEISHHEYKDDH